MTPRSGPLGVSAGMLGCSERPGPDSPVPGSSARSSGGQGGVTRSEGNTEPPAALTESRNRNPKMLVVILDFIFGDINGREDTYERRHLTARAASGRRSAHAHAHAPRGSGASSPGALSSFELPRNVFHAG